jgi:Na+-driven multidrug efflux pump
VFQLSDAVGAVSGGILRGIGRQDLGAWMNVFGYYVVGLPFGVFGKSMEKAMPLSQCRKPKFIF